MKKVMVCGCGAQGSTICRKLVKEPLIEEVVCADYNFEAAKAVCKLMKKGTPKQVNAANVDEIAKAAEGCELIINVMPLHFGVNVLQAAIQNKCCYQDLAAPEDISDMEDDLPGKPYQWLDGIRMLYEDYGKKFAENGQLAVVGTGSAPGVMCVVARKAVQELDECDTLNMMVYEGCHSKRFIPFWWSPEVALDDMRDSPNQMENGQLILTEPFSHPIKRNWPECGCEVTLKDHNHEEPVFVYFNREKYFKNCKNAYFKYGGFGADFCEPLVQAGLLNHEEEDYDGESVAPFDVILNHIPNPPKNPDDIKSIIEEGMIADNGAFVCEAYGKKNGKDVMVELHLNAPDLKASYEKAKMTSEMYLTGQGAFLYTKLLVNDMIEQRGLITSDMLTDKQVNQYLEWAKDLDLTYTTEIKEGVVWENK